MFGCYHRSSCDDLVYMWMSYSYAPGFAKLTNGVSARAMMINIGWNKCAFEQSRHLWVSSWILPRVSRILFDLVIPVVLPLDGHSCWVITRTARLYKQIDLVIRDNGVGNMIEERRIWAHYALDPEPFLFDLKVLLIYAPVFIVVLCIDLFFLIFLLHISCSWFFIVCCWSLI